MKTIGVKLTGSLSLVALLAAALVVVVSGCGKESDSASGHDHSAIQSKAQAAEHQHGGMAITGGSSNAPAGAMKMEGMGMQHEGHAGHTAGTAMQGEGEVFYSCPMHPNIVSDKPGKCPICGMTFQPHKKAQGTGIPGRAPVELSLVQRQLINIRTQPAVTGPAVATICPVGIVAYDQTRLANVNTRVTGWAEKLYVDKPGQFVKQGAPLMDIYSPELYSAQYEYLLAYRHCVRLGHIMSPTNGVSNTAIWTESMDEAEALVRSARKRLELWEITDDDIAALEKTGKPMDTLQLRSPVGGFVIEKNIDPAQMVMSGKTLYRLADLSTVWINADIYEYELPLVKVGQKVNVTTVAYPGQVFDATVDFIYPYTEGKTRTTTVRLVLDNQKGLFKPDMYVNAVIEVHLGERLLIPRSAVFDTGKRQYVFVEEKEGMYSPREVEVGSRVNGQVIVNNGLMAGQNVVVDGNFLLDSESQLKSAGTAGGHQH